MALCAVLARLQDSVPSESETIEGDLGRMLQSLCAGERMNSHVELISRVPCGFVASLQEMTNRGPSGGV